jgi:hypothetical protein
MLKIYGFFALVIILLGVGCSQPADDNTDTTENPKQLVAGDLQAMAQFQSPSVAAFDQSNRNLFTAIFGGEDGPALRAYLDARIHYYFTPAEMASFSSQPSDFVHKGWYTSATPETGGVADTVNSALGAANIGTQIWLNGLVDNTPVTIYAEGQTIAVADSRVGLMMIGPAYIGFIHATDGNDYPVPSGFRQSILLHEARHSDCTGGIGQADLDILRQSPSAQWTDANFKDRECGHLHTYCPSGEFKNKLACDDLPWGAYAVQYVYLQATINSYDGVDHAIMEATLADMRSRLLFDVDDMLTGQMGAPDMSTEGVH